ncbi:MAG: S41 family peptidase [Alphaproteobacteria bacterium]
MRANSSIVTFMKRSTKLIIASGFAVTVAVACAVGLGVQSPEARDAASRIEEMVDVYRGGAPGPQGDGIEDARLFAQAFQRIRYAYVRETDSEALYRAADQSMREAHPDPSAASDAELIEAAIQGMLHSLDDYSTYMDENAFAALNQVIRGSFGGLGIEIKKDPVGLEVISPIDGTPAMRAGIRPGDRLTHADGLSLAELTLQEAVELLRGEPGTTVTVTVLRGDEEQFDVPLTREIIQVQRVRSRTEDGIGYLRITHFVRNTGRALRQEMRDMRRAAGDGNLLGFVVDLRSNPGGLLDESIDVAGAFLRGGMVVSTRSRVSSEEFNADSADPSGGLPVVVLINQGSASASEIVAAAIRDRGRGVIVGERSFGKGSVQTTFEFTQGGGLKLTTALYYTPSGATVEGGVAPNVEGVDDPDTEEVDEALEIAFDVLRALAAGQEIETFASQEVVN